jgi:hypothetical protein
MYIGSGLFPFGPPPSIQEMRNSISRAVSPPSFANSP